LAIWATLLGEVMDHLFADHATTGRLKLLAQSNFNLPGGEPGSLRARLALSALPPEVCELVEGPFESEEYLDVFARADVILIPYDQDNYAARSSGVFAEALAAGKPTVVTRGTWMATILEPYRQAYLDQLRKKLRRAQGSASGWTGSITRDRTRGESTRGDVGQLAGLERRTHLFFEAEFDRMERQHHLVVVLKFKDARGETVGVLEETVWLCRRLVRARP
jgi:hypothetical protein